jgi:hypothetical protein
MVFVPHRKYLWGSTACYGDIFNFILQVIKLSLYERLINLLRHCWNIYKYFGYKNYMKYMLFDVLIV